MITLTDAQWNKITNTLSDAIEFAEGMVGDDESETLKSLRQNETEIANFPNGSN